MKPLLSALRFLTVFPLGLAKERDADLGKSLAFFPLVGALIGLVAVAINRILLLVLPVSVANVLVVVALIILRGGLHLDGLMDTADGLFSQKDRPRMLEVMRDSRVGAFGVISLAAVLLVKWSALNAFDFALRWRALLLAPAMGELAIVYSAWRYPYAREGEGAGKLFADEAGGLQLTIAALAVLALSLLLLPVSGAFLFIVFFVLLVIALAGYVAGKLGGFTGDAYGAIAEVGETLSFVLMLAVIKS